MAIPDTLDGFLEESGLGSVDKALSNMLYGINATNTKPPVPYNANTPGWVFFTRPQLNLRSDNIRRSRDLYRLLTKTELSIQRYIRVILDPRSPYEINVNGLIKYTDDRVNTPLIDKFNPFIPILTNSLKSTSGWPDIALGTKTTSPGIRKENIYYVDSDYLINNTTNLTFSFFNYKNDPILALFDIWVKYQSLVFEGIISPYIDFILENEIDYQTRIYNIITDRTWRYLSHIAAPFAASPISVPTGKVFDYDHSKSYQDQNKEINITFQAVGMRIDEDILIKEFNEVIGIFNPEYRAYLQGDKTSLEVVPYELLPFLNYRCYPYIDLKTYEVKWLISKSNSKYKKIIGKE